jgi:hypothetical protein
MADKNLEYRLVWPNHEVYNEQILPENVDMIETAIHNNLKQLGVPRDYWPYREARVVTVTVDPGVWEPPAAAEKKVPGKGKAKDK